MSEVDGATLIARSLKQQGIDHLFGVVGFPITPIAAAAQKEGVVGAKVPLEALAFQIMSMVHPKDRSFQNYSNAKHCFGGRLR